MSISRILSALVLIVIVSGTIWWLPPWATVALAALAAAAAGTELAGLARPLGAHVSPLFVGMSAAASCVALVVPEALPVPIGPDALVALLMGVTLALGLIVLASTPPGPAVFAAAAVMALAPIYIGLPLGAVAWIRVTAGPGALTWLVAVIALSDSAQYYAGNFFGRRKLSPVVSPRKTVEGAIGGLLVASIAGAALSVSWLPATSLPVAALLALVLASFGIAGDLFESLLKRSVGAKDSSSLIPGHGGVLDRIDAYLFAAPLFYLFLRYLA